MNKSYDLGKQSSLAKKKEKRKTHSVSLQRDHASPNATQLLTSPRYLDQQVKLRRWDSH